MNFLEFIISISFLVVLTGLFLNGWHRVTRHFIVVQPDNTERVEGLLLKWWSYWIERVKGTKRIYYIGNALGEKYNELKRLLPAIGGQLSIDKNGEFLLVKEGAEISKEEVDKIERVLKIKVLSTKDAVFSFYIEEDIYYLPSWIRDPLSSCVICMSSVYGSVSYWSFVYLVDGAFNWTSHPISGIILIYIGFIVILSCFVVLFARKIN